MSKKEEGIEDIEYRLHDLERIIKSAGLKLADDWALFFMRPSKEEEDELYLDIQLGMVLLLHMTWQGAHGYSIEPKMVAKELAPHDIKEEEILRILEKMRKVELVGKEETGAFKGYYYLNCSEFIERVGKALGFEKDLEQRMKKPKPKK